MVNWVEIDRLVQAYHSVDAGSSEEALLRRLRQWWCFYYKRPFKEPLLDTYTLQELVFEYLTVYYMNPENDPLEKKRKESQSKSDEEWAKEQLKNVQKINPPDPNKPKDIDSTLIPPLPEVSTNFEK